MHRHLRSQTTFPLHVKDLPFSAAHCDSVLQARVDKMKETLSVLNYMGDSQVETTLLRSCLALPKLSYILRTYPPDYISHATRQFDSTMRESLETIVSSLLTDCSWQKASLPSNRGGLNLRSAVSHAPAAFISSKTLVERILNHPINLDAYLENAVSALSSSSSHPESR